jgi:hypothetical protein
MNKLKRLEVLTAVVLGLYGGIIIFSVIYKHTHNAGQKVGCVQGRDGKCFDFKKAYDDFVQRQNSIHGLVNGIPCAQVYHPENDPIHCSTLFQDWAHQGSLHSFWIDESLAHLPSGICWNLHQPGPPDSQGFRPIINYIPDCDAENMLGSVCVGRYQKANNNCTMGSTQEEFNAYIGWLVRHMRAGVCSPPPTLKNDGFETGDLSKWN